MSGWGACDVCGAPATSMARDMLDVADAAVEIWRRLTPVGRTKRGCDAHPVKSEDLSPRPFDNDAQ